MPIVSSDIVLRLSGGDTNTVAANSLGGVISSQAGGIITTNVLNNIWDDVTGAESSPGDVEYRGIYVKNAHGSLTLTSAVIWISSNTTSTNDEVDIAIGSSAVNGTEQTIANESTAPTGGVTFSHPTTFGAGLSLGNLPFGQHRAVWLRRTVDASAGAKDNNAYTLSVQGETSE